MIVMRTWVCYLLTLGIMQPKQLHAVIRSFFAWRNLFFGLSMRALMEISQVMTDFERGNSKTDDINQ